MCANKLGFDGNQFTCQLKVSVGIRTNDRSALIGSAWRIKLIEHRSNYNTEPIKTRITGAQWDTGLQKYNEFYLVHKHVLIAL